MRISIPQHPPDISFAADYGEETAGSIISIIPGHGMALYAHCVIERCQVGVYS